MANIYPTVPQYDFITSKFQYPAFVAGYGAGKTEASVKRSLIGLLTHPGLSRGYYAPTYDLLRMIAFPRFEAACIELGLDYKLYKSPLNYLEVYGYGKVYFRSMDAPERIIGYEHADCDIDELDTMPTEKARKALDMITSRNRQLKPIDPDTGLPFLNTIGVSTTPEGFRLVYEIWKKDQKKAEANGYKIYQAPTMSNPHLPPDYIPSLRKRFPEAQLNAYLNGEFVNLTSGSVFYTFDREDNRSFETIQPRDALYIGMDFNVQQMAAIVYVKRKGIWHAVDELVGIFDTPAMIEEIDKRYPNRSITIYPDASGDNRKSVGASETDISLLKKSGFRVKVKKKNPLVKDRILSACNAFEKFQVMVNVDMCPEYTSCLEQIAYDDKGKPDKQSGFDHAIDAGTYPIIYEMPIKKPVLHIESKFL